MQGRGGNKFHFENNYVTKLTASLREAEFMKAFPLAFIPVLETQPLKMPRWHDAELLEQREALTTGLKLLKKYVWTKPANKKPEWKLLLSQHSHNHESQLEGLLFRMDGDAQLRFAHLVIGLKNA